MGSHKILHVKENKTNKRKQGLNERREKNKKKKKGPKMGRGRQGPLLTHLTQRALHAAQEVSLLQPVVIAADVMNFKPQALHLFKVKVHSKQF